LIIRWHGHACFEVRDNITIVTDPHDGKSLGIKPPTVKGDLILVSHDHFDHNSVRTVKGQNSQVVDKPGKRVIQDMDLEGIMAFHDEVEGAKRGEDIIFKFKVGDMELVHLGDLGHIPEGETLEKLKGADIMFIPVGGVFTIDDHKAHDLIQLVRPKIAIPMHYRVGGLSLSIQPLKPFSERFDPEMIMHVGNEVELLKEDLPEETEIWVFSL